MEIFNIDKKMIIPKLEKSYATISYFDAIHLGHKELINKTKAKGVKSLVITFDDLGIDTLFPLEERIKLIESLEVDYLVILKYEDFHNMFYYELNKMFKKLKVTKVIVNKKYRYGFKNEGDYIDLENKFEVDLLPEYLINDNVVSSFDIINYLKRGLIEEANELLGFNYYIKSTVVSGNELGRTIGYPTANIDSDTFLNGGVYKTITTINDITYNSITNIGYNPTFNKQDTLKIETHILDFNEDIYNEIIKVEFINKVRNEIKFNSKEELIIQLNKDKEVWT